MTRSPFSRTGTFTLHTTGPDGQPTAMTGGWMNYFTRVEDEWKIAGQITNFDSPPPAAFPYFAGSNEPPPNEGTMHDLTNAWMMLYNLGHASKVAAFYTDDAAAAFPDQPFVAGRAAIEAGLAEGMAGGTARIESNNVGTLELGDGWALDGCDAHWTGKGPARPGPDPYMRTLPCALAS